MAIVLTIAGYTGCGWYSRLLKFASKNPNVRVVNKEMSRSDFKQWIQAHDRANSHRTSPASWLGGDDTDPNSVFIGGHDDTVALLKQDPSTWPVQAQEEPNKRAKLSSDGEFDYELVVIGGGSGGLACARAAADILPTNKVAVLDFVKPSPKGTTWGIGGTCVNVGCIPKKLMHHAAQHGEAIHDSKDYGWQAGKGTAHAWATLRDNVQGYIGKMNRGYIKTLESKKVKYFNALGSFVDAHTVKVQFGDGTSQNITSRYIVVAVGGRPYKLGCEGEEHAISSDDLFSLKKSPGKTLVVGASYVALECGGFLKGIGFDTTIMVRSILLRGFDQECGNRIADYMKSTGIKMIRSATVSNITPTADGRLQVTWAKNDSARGRHLRPQGHDGHEVFDTVLSAIGRYIDTEGLNLKSVGVKVNNKGEIISGPNGKESTNVPSIFALGDCLENVPELTPVAIQAGKYLAKRLFADSAIQMPYQNVATTVFTPIEYSSIGVSEDDVMEDDATAESSKVYVPNPDATYRYKKLKPGYKVYRKTFVPLEWKLLESRRNLKCFMKVICEGTSERIVGIHYVGPNAGEIMQGFSLAVRMGATFADLQATVGIHPTSAEHFTILSAANSAGTAKSSVPTSSTFGKPRDQTHFATIDTVKADPTIESKPAFIFGADDGDEACET